MTTTTGVSAGSLLEIERLSKVFRPRKRLLRKSLGEGVRAVNDVSLTIPAGSTVGLVGESGSGKSTLGRLILRLEEPTDGSIRFEGRSLLEARGEKLRKMRKDIQMVFQNPYGSLNPRMDIASLISEGWVVHPETCPTNRDERITELMQEVGLRPEWRNRYPSQFSGGQRQRIGIARALAVNPRLLVCDEAVSALDVSVQAQILKLLKEIQRRTGISYLFISHDLSVVRHVSDYVAVMNLGTIVEYGRAEDVYERPLHPYTRALLDAVPHLGGSSSARNRSRLVGEPPNPADPPSGCPFRTRCWKADDLCAQVKPGLEPGEGLQVGACHHPLW